MHHLDRGDAGDRHHHRPPHAPRDPQRGAGDPARGAQGLQAVDGRDVAGRLRQEDGPQDGRSAVHQGADRPILFYSGIVSAGFDVCDGAADDRRQPRQARGADDLPPPRILSIDIVRFETINEDVGLPERDRARGSQPLVRRGARGARAGGPGAGERSHRAQTHARELFAGVRRVARLHADLHRGGRRTTERPTGGALHGCVRADGGRRRWPQARRQAGGRARARQASRAAAARPSAAARLHRQRRDGALVVAARAGRRAPRSRCWRSATGTARRARGDRSRAAQSRRARRRCAIRAAGSLSAELTAPRAGAYRVLWTRGDKHARLPDASRWRRTPAAPATSGRRRRSGRRRTPGIAATRTSSRPGSRAVRRAVEQSLDFRPLHQALRDPARNFLYGYLGLREDDPKNKAAIVGHARLRRPAVLPARLLLLEDGAAVRVPRLRPRHRRAAARAARASTATRSRPSGKETLRRSRASSAQHGEPRPVGERAHRARRRRHRLLSGRRSRRKALRPGVDLRRSLRARDDGREVGRQTPARGGLLLAVDGQPDTSIGRKRFWEGTFLFANDVKSAGPGFKAFRPVARGADGKLASVRQQGDRRRRRSGARAVLRRAGEAVAGRVLRAHGQAHQPAAASTPRRPTARRWTRWSSS